METREKKSSGKRWMLKHSKKSTGRTEEINKNITKHNSSAVRLWWAGTGSSALEKGSKVSVLHPCATPCPLLLSSPHTSLYNPRAIFYTSPQPSSRVYRLSWGKAEAEALCSPLGSFHTQPSITEVFMSGTKQSRFHNTGHFFVTFLLPRSI